MKRRLAIVYDTANVVGHINRHNIESKHLLAPLLLPLPADLVVAIIPVIKKDLAPLVCWDKILEKVFLIARTRTSSFDLYKEEKEFSYYLTDIKLALKEIEILDDVSGIMRLKPTSRYRPYVVKDPEPKTCYDERAREDLIQLARGLRECDEANLHEVVEDMQMYFLPYIDLLEKGFAIALITSDKCFSGLVRAYSSQRGLDVEVVEVAVLAKVEQLIRRLRGVLRNSNNASL
jgi:hypothetical protein